MKAFVSTGFAGIVLMAALAGCNHGRGGDTPPKPSAEERRKTLPPAPVTYEMHLNGLPKRGIWKCDPAVADINGDGFLDIAAIPRLEPSTLAWLGDGKGNWRVSAQGLQWDRPTCGGDTVLIDVNRDGKLDLVTADHCAGVFVYLGDGAGNWQMVTDHLHPETIDAQSGRESQFFGAESVAVGDINGDGNVDLISIGSDDGGLNVWYGDGTGHKWTHVDDNLPKTRYGVRVRLYDVNKDGKLDVICTREEGPRCWLNLGDSKWRDFSTGFPSPTTGGLYNGLAMADVNKDGLVDVVVGNWVDGPEVYLQRTDGAWQKQPTVFPECKGGGWGVAVSDLDGDGNQDIAFCGRLPYEVGYVYGIFVLLGDGTGSKWRWIENSGLPETGLEFNWGVAIADLNNDGTPDLVVTSGAVVASADASGLKIQERVLTFLGKRRAAAGNGGATAPAKTSAAMGESSRAESKREPVRATDDASSEWVSHNRWAHSKDSAS